jgi:hypothetical protein
MKRVLKVVALAGTVVVAVVAILLAVDRAAIWYRSAHPTYPDAMRD